MFSIRTNFSSITAQRNLSATQGELDGSMRKLSSGYRITRGADDAAGLAISEKLKTQVIGTNQAVRNANDGISLIQTAEGGIAEIGNIVQRVRELAVQASNGTLTGSDQLAIGREMVALRSEISAITSRTNFNGVTLLDANAATAAQVVLQVGANNGTGDTLSVTLSNFDASTAGTGALLSFGQQIESFVIAASAAAANPPTGAATAGQTAAQGLISVSDTALGYINNKRADLGSVQNRLEHTISVQQIASENMANAESRIRDVDVAAETAKMSKSNILMQAGVSVLAQANQLPQLALKLLG
jgi:flagellin